MRQSVSSTIRADALLLLTATIWGLAFVAQREGMRHIGPFSFNGIRFALGSVSLAPLILWRRRRASGRNRLSTDQSGMGLPLSGVLAGAALFGGASLQQIGIIYTTAGKAGFITGLYVILVPIIGLARGQSAGWSRWIGASLAVAGLYFLSMTSGMTMERGDFLVLLGAFFWAGHVHMIATFARRHDPLQLAALQFGVCSVLSLTIGLVTESWTMAGVTAATLPILWGGICSVGIAYTLQVVAQRDAHPAHAAILLSLEGVFAAVGGWIILGETLTPRGLVGCAFMLAGMMASSGSHVDEHGG